MFAYTAREVSRVANPTRNPTVLIRQDETDRYDNMIDTMYAAPGVGLAAPQVGVALRLFVVDPSSGRSTALVPTSTRWTPADSSRRAAFVLVPPTRSPLR